jgi:putative SOS response-associated peptidase YedK
VFAQKPAKLKAAMADILENAEADLTPQMRNLIDMLWSDWKLVEQQIEDLNDELERINVVPDTFQPVIRRSHETGERVLVMMRWGIVPWFAKTEAEFEHLSTINAKSNRLTEKQDVA